MQKLKALEDERAKVQAQRDKSAKTQAKLETRADEALAARLRQLDMELEQLRARATLVEQLMRTGSHRVSILRECVETGLKAMTSLETAKGERSLSDSVQKGNRQTGKRSEQERLVQQANRVLGELQLQDRTAALSG